MNLRRELRVAFAGGGTGGHFYPAIAICEKLESLCQPGGFSRLFFGTTRGIEFRQQERYGYPLITLPVRGLVRRFTLNNFLVPFHYLRSISLAKSALRDFRPDVVVGTGGYVSLPVLKAAAQLNLPYVIQEQNSFAGLSTRKAAASAARIFTAFPEVVNQLTQFREKIREFGNPIRGDVGSVARQDARQALNLAPDAIVVLVLGGSQGARAINQSILGSIKITPLPSTVQLLWQTGERDFAEVVSQAGEIAQNHTLFPFAADMAPLYAASDIAICRAGALTLAELERAALPAILIPYPSAAANHQEHNARAAAARGDVKLCLESELLRRDPLSEAQALVADGTATRMSQQLRQRLGNHKPAADLIAEEILQVIDQSNKKRT